MRSSLRCVLVLVSGLVTVYAALAGQSNLGDFRVTSHGQDDGGDFCRGFNFTPAQASWFFGRAKVLTAAQQHDRFNYLPCWVRGTAQNNSGTWQWEVRAGGTARLIAPDGTAQLLGCDNCDAVLRGQESPRSP